MHLHSWRLVAHSLPSLPELNRRVAPINRIPRPFWLVVAAVLFIVVSVHAKARLRREMAQFSEERGWQFSVDRSPIEEADWQQLAQNAILSSLSSVRGRKNFIWGTHCGVTFVMFEGGPGTRIDSRTRTPSTMIALCKPEQPSPVPSLAFGMESGGWKKYLTDNWVFLAPTSPQWVVRSEQAKRFVEEAYEVVGGRV
jgi:hypothetical protein